MHNRVAIEQIKVIKAEEEVRIVRNDLIQLCLRGKPFPDVNAVPDDEALVPDGPEAAVPGIGRRSRPREWCMG
jgi:hypothetical protein